MTTWVETGSVECNPPRINTEMMMVSLDERVSRLEAKLDSLATKEDLANLKADVTEKLANVQAGMKELEGRLIKWTMGTVMFGMAIVVSIAIAF